MELFFREKNFIEVENIKKDVFYFFEHSPASFYDRGIKILPERREKVITNEGEYFND